MMTALFTGSPFWSIVKVPVTPVNPCIEASASRILAGSSLFAFRIASISMFVAS